MSISKYFTSDPTRSSYEARSTRSSKGKRPHSDTPSDVVKQDKTSTKADAQDGNNKRVKREEKGSSNDALREEWRTLYAETLPKAARERLPSQAKWPVTLDHCFGRIILDNAVGVDRPWTETIKSPAIKNMTEGQFRAAIDLGHRILEGEVDLVDLDEKSLALRGKRSKQASSKTSKSPTKASGNVKPKRESLSDASAKDVTGSSADQDREELEALIDTSDKTDFQKRCLKALLQIPRGQFSTYGAMAKALNSSPRAVGNAMRGNPFAPRVPCHRILAADRSIGGFGGSWGVEGKHYNEKLDLLHNEGLRFDSKGKVIGPVFSDFQ